MRQILIYLLLIYCFTFGILGRELGGFPYGTLVEVFLFIILIYLLVSTPSEDWARINKDIVYLFLIWFIISLLQVINPGSSTMGWLMEIRSTALYPFLIIPFGLLVLKDNRHLDIFIILIVSFSTLASLNGIKQLHIGLSSGEQRFLDEGASLTHLLWGRLRVFSFYSDAGQFGASQAQLGLMTFLLALGPFKLWKRALLAVCAGLMIYGMLISGTRGALFALIVGGFVAIFLSKKIKILILGGIVALGFLFVLKYTHIGSGNYQIYRLRSALDPTDPSLHVRFNTQKVLSEYMKSRPFGGGLGVIGFNGTRYNQDKYLSTIQPDSYFVKLWAMYGITGFTIWLCIMLYILGKCCGIVWRIKDEELKVKMIALTAGFSGALFCSYGNEVINTMPTSIVVYLSLVFIFIAPELEKSVKSPLLK